MPSHFGSGYFPEPGGTFLSLHRTALLDVGVRAVETSLFVVPERESNGAFRLHVGHREDARQLHHDRGAGGVVIRRLTPADAVHVPADDVHLVRVLRADFHANHFLALARRGRLHVDRADRRVGLSERVVVHAALAHVAEDAASARAVAAEPRPLGDVTGGRPRPPPAPRRLARRRSCTDT